MGQDRERWPRGAGKLGVGGHVYCLGVVSVFLSHMSKCTISCPFKHVWLLLVSYSSVKLFGHNQCRCWVGNGFGAEEPVGVCPESWLCFGRRDDQGQQLKPALGENPEDLVMDTGGGEKLGKRVIFSVSC